MCNEWWLLARKFCFSLGRGDHSKGTPFHTLHCLSPKLHPFCVENDHYNPLFVSTHSVWEVLIIATNPPYNFRGVSLFPLGSLSKALHGSWLGVCVHASVSMWCLLVFASFAGMASLFDIRAQNLQSPPKESIHFCRAEYSKLRGARWKVGGAPNPTFPLAPLDFEYLALPQVYTFFQWRL